MHASRALLAVAVLCSLPTLALAAAPVNLLPNGDFSSAAQLTGWQGFGAGTVTWNADDANAAAGSGSMQLDTDSAGDLMDKMSTCFAVTPGAAYSYGLSSKLIAGTNPSRSFVCAVYASAMCSNGITGLTPSPQSTFATNWTAWGTASGTLPTNAQSVQCDMSFNNLGSASPASIRIDNVFFNSIAPTTPVSLQSFEVK